MSLELNTIHNQFYIILGKYIKARINDTGGKTGEFDHLIPE